MQYEQPPINIQRSQYPISSSNTTHYDTWGRNNRSGRRPWIWRWKWTTLTRKQNMKHKSNEKKSWRDSDGENRRQAKR